MAFTNEQIERYSRHIILKEVGVKGQKKLLNAKVLIIGAGGLGAPAAMYLAAAGVGTIGIADADEVDLSNLQRQIIHATADVGKAKVQSAKETMEAINPTGLSSPAKTSWILSRTMISSLTAQTTFRQSSSSTMPALWRRSRSPMPVLSGFRVS